MQLLVQIRGPHFPFRPHPEQIICAVTVPELGFFSEDWQGVKEGNVASLRPRLWTFSGSAKGATALCEGWCRPSSSG